MFSLLILLPASSGDSTTAFRLRAFKNKVRTQLIFVPLCLNGVGPGLGCTSPQTSMAEVVALYDAEELL